MRQLQLMTVMAALTSGLVFGCDNTSETDAGSGGSDSGLALDGGGGGGTDAGSGGTDAGGGGTDAGAGGSCTGPTMGDCDITVPTSCGTGMACVFSGSSMTNWMAGCVTSGVGGQGAACDPGMQGQCQEGFSCGQGNTCQKICCTAVDCGTGEFCGLIGGLNAGLCSVSDECDLVAQTGCEAGEGCYLGTVRVCTMAGTLSEGESCMFLNDCSAGHACVGAAGASNCRAYCDMSATDPCPSGFMCNGLTGAPTGVGVCVPAT